MVLSTDLPLTMAHRLAPPLPRWQLTARSSAMGMPRNFAASCATYWWLVPWKPYLRKQYLRASLAGRA